MRSLSQKGREAGMSLVEVLVGVGILGIVAIVGMQQLNNTMMSRKSLEIKGERANWARMIADQVDCAATLPQPGTATCLNNRIDVKDKTGRIIIKQSGLKTGGLTLKALCTPEGLDVKFAQLKRTASIDATAASSFMPDPLTKKSMGWRSVFPEGAICSVVWSAQPRLQAVSKTICMPKETTGTLSRWREPVNFKPTFASIAPAIINMRPSSSASSYYAFAAANFKSTTTATPGYVLDNSGVTFTNFQCGWGTPRQNEIPSTTGCGVDTCPANIVIMGY